MRYTVINIRHPVTVLITNVGFCLKMIRRNMLAARITAARRGMITTGIQSELENLVPYAGIAKLVPK